MAIQAQMYSENLGFPLSGSQDWIVMDSNNGCGTGTANVFGQFPFNISQKQQQQQQQLYMQELENQKLHLLQQRNQNLWLENNFLISVPKNNYSQSTTDNITHSSSSSMAAYSQSIAVQVEKYSQEIDQYLKVQNLRLRLALQEQRKQQVGTLLKKIESNTTALLMQKDEEIARGAKRIMELQDLLRRLEMENQSWKRVAQEKEAMVVSLNNTLEQMRERASCCLSNNGAEDAESCCDMEERENTEEEGDNRDVEQRRLKKRKTNMVCRGCNSRSSCVLFLPCRHLCSCKACEAFLDSCPVCQTPKKASIEALIF